MVVTQKYLYSAIVKIYLNSILWKGKISNVLTGYIVYIIYEYLGHLAVIDVMRPQMVGR